MDVDKKGNLSTGATCNVLALDACLYNGHSYFREDYSPTGATASHGANILSLRLEWAGVDKEYLDERKAGP